MVAGSALAQRALRVLVVVQCVGAACWWWRDGSNVGALLVWPAARVLGALVVALALLVAVRPRRAPLLAIAALMLTEALVGAVAGEGYARLAPLSQAVRYGGPIALLYFGASSGTSARRILGWAACAVFIAHGFEALTLRPQFVDYLQVTFARAAHLTISVSTAHTLLLAIGAADVFVALLVLFRPTRPVLAYMAGWGFLTAAMRLVYYGPADGLGPALVRSLNGGAPLVLLLATLPPLRMGLRREERQVSVAP